MSILSVEQIGHSFNDKWLFKDITLGIARGQRIALVGYNGAGKSTLLKIIAEKLIPEKGKVVKERDLTIGYLEQDPDFSAQDTVADFIYSQDNTQQQLIRQYEELLSSERPDEKLLNDLTDRLSETNAWEYEYQIKTIIARLSVNKPGQKISTLSGGQKKRLALAKLLIDEPDVYILDEPTNHLDIEMIEWLESYFTTGNKTVFLVTHDRYFLDNICNKILELESGKLYSYDGKYSYYLEKKAERLEAEQSSHQKNTNLLKKELEWMRRQPQARGTKSKARIEAFYDLEEKTKAHSQAQKVELSMKVARQGNKILEIEQLVKGFQGNKIIDNFSYVFKKGDKIGLAGKNGSGKSTFLNLITGHIKPDTGSIIRGETTVFGYYHQGGLSIKSDERVIDIVKQVADFIPMSDGRTITAAQLLTLFLFPPARQFEFVSKLSGGEKKRLQLMRVLMTNPNFLILDEPTNDLDIDTLNVLEEFLENYKGVLVLVSHDRYLMDKLTEQLFVFEDNAHLRVYSGNYTGYRIEKQAIENTSQKNKAAVEIVKKEPKSKLSFKEQKELEELDKQIPELEEQIKMLYTNLNSSDHHEIIKLSQDISVLKNKADLLTLRWLELNELKES